MKKTYITDFGQQLAAMKGDEVVMTIDRYGVWAWDAFKGKHQVVSTGSDLELLQKEFGPCEVIPIGTP